MEKFSINSCVKFSVVEELNNEFTLCKCYAHGLGKNRNLSFIGKEATNKALPTLKYAPIVAHLYKDEEGNYRVGGHDYVFTEDGSYKSVCVPYGVVKDDTFSYETVNEYGKDVEYLTCLCILWTGRYPELKEAIYSDDVYFNESMEINVNQFRPLEEDSNYTEILDFSYSALCLLNKSDDKDKNVEPCFISSCLMPVGFNADNFADQLNEMKEAMSKCFNLQSKDGEEKVAENVTEVTEVTTEPIIDEPVDTTPEPTFEISNYQLTANEKRNSLRSVLNSMSVVNNETDTWYYLNDYDDNYAYVEQCVYTFATDNIVSKYGRVGYTFNATEAEITSDFEEMRLMWLTLDEADKLEEARNNYDSIKEEVTILRPYKLAADKAEREKAESEVFAKYDERIGDMPEYIALKEKSSEYEIEQLDKECIMLVGMFTMREEPVKKTEEKAETSTIKFSMETQTKCVSPYGDYFERYGNTED